MTSIVPNYYRINIRKMKSVTPRKPGNPVIGAAHSGGKGGTYVAAFVRELAAALFISFVAC